jgi:hypothetical protein
VWKRLKTASRGASRFRKSNYSLIEYDNYGKVYERKGSTQKNSEGINHFKYLK